MGIITDCRRRAFSLIEAAIVLGVIGLVIGSIWAAAAYFTLSYKINQTFSGLLVAVQEYRKTYSSTSADQLLATQGNYYVDMLAFTNVPNYTEAGGFWLNPFGHAVDVQISHNAYYDADQIGIAFYDVPYDDCMKILSRLKSAPILNELFVINTPANYYTTLPFTPTVADCTNVSHLDFLFKK